MNAVIQDIDRLDTDATGNAFTRLLHWLDDGADSQGERYLEMRGRLVAYFDRRNRPAPDLLADETLDRVSKTLEESGRIQVTPPARYCYVVARFVLLEDIRRANRYVPFDEASPAVHSTPAPTAAGGSDAAQQSLACLGRCLGTLAAADRDLIVEYYRDAKRQRIERRRALAERRGISMNALGIRAWRLRASLERCVGGCRKQGRKILPAGVL
jgi:DNA-directed RNA polymerase specialized sigma24 family protein